MCPGRQVLQIVTLSCTRMTMKGCYSSLTSYNSKQRTWRTSTYICAFMCMAPDDCAVNSNDLLQLFRRCQER
jgi:hypothetical protein